MVVQGDRVNQSNLKTLEWFLEIKRPAQSRHATKIAQVTTCATETNGMNSVL